MCEALRERPWREAMRGFHQMSQKQRVIATMNCFAVHQVPSLLEHLRTFDEFVILMSSVHFITDAGKKQRGLTPKSRGYKHQ